jgi:hypothetical protein
MDYWYINGGKMGILEAIHISESLYEPEVHVGAIQSRLNGLQQKGEVGYYSSLSPSQC